LDNLNPTKAPRVRKELLDADYLNKLSDKDLEWYAKFMSEWAGANIKKSKKTKRPLTRHLHKSNAKAKEIFDANNHRNNDVHGVTKANGLLYDISKERDYITNPSLTEDALIAMIDNKDVIPPETED
jgi:hypothetical protein